MGHASEDIYIKPENPRFFDKIFLSMDFKEDASQRKLYFKITENGSNVDFISVERPWVAKPSRFTVSYQISIISSLEQVIESEKKLYEELSKVMTSEENKISFLSRKPDGTLLKALQVPVNKIGEYKIKVFKEGLEDNILKELSLQIVDGNIIEAFIVDPKKGVMGIKE